MNRWYAFPGCRFIWCPPRHLAVASLLTYLFWRYAPTHHQFIRCWKTRGQNLTVSFHETIGWTVAWTIGSSGATSRWLGPSLSCFFKPSHRPMVSTMNRQFIQRFCLLFFLSSSSSGVSRNWTVGSSDGALSFTQCTNSSDHFTDACYLGTVGSCNGGLSFLFLLRFWLLKNIPSSHFGMWYFDILGT
jgi:hypothetical protein